MKLNCFFAASPCEEPNGLQCENGGTCLLVDNGNAVCKCLPGYIGDKCQSKFLYNRTK